MRRGSISGVPPRSGTPPHTYLRTWQHPLTKPSSQQKRRLAELYLGRGGIYRSNELRHRAEMLGLLKTRVNLMTQDLKLLFFESLQHRPSRPDEPV
jgi:hypothetical protein